MKLRLSTVIAFACVLSYAHAETAIEAAIGLYVAKHYPEAEAALKKVIAADPKNAAACYYLGHHSPVRA